MAWALHNITIYREKTNAHSRCMHLIRFIPCWKYFASLHARFHVGELWEWLRLLSYLTGTLLHWSQHWCSFWRLQEDLVLSVPDICSSHCIVLNCVYILLPFSGPVYSFFFLLQCIASYLLTRRKREESRYWRGFLLIHRKIYIYCCDQIQFCIAVKEIHQDHDNIFPPSNWWKCVYIYIVP